MKVINVILQIIILYGFYIMGSWIQHTFDLFVPGSILGMLLLLLCLATGVCKLNWLESGSNLLLTHMPLLFLPVTVGILNYLDLFSGHGILLIVIVLISTSLVMVSSALISQFLAARREQQ